MDTYGYKDLNNKEKWSAEEVLEFWKNPVNKSERENNNPANYLKGEKRSKYVVELISQYLSQDSRILEIGCNVGRNLNFLYNAGFINLSGIEINKDAINLMASTYPDMFKNTIIMNSSVEVALPNIIDESYDLIFTMAVLEHIHYDSEFIFSDIARIAKRYIITIEDEITLWSERHFPRNYKDIFENSVWKQIFEINCQNIGILDDRFWVRIFRK